MIISHVMQSILSDICTAALTFFGLLFVWYFFHYPFTCNLLYDFIVKVFLVRGIRWSCLYPIWPSLSSSGLIRTFTFDWLLISKIKVFHFASCFLFYFISFCLSFSWISWVFLLFHFIFAVDLLFIPLPLTFYIVPKGL